MNEEERTFCLHIAYVGTGYRGWQRQSPKQEQEQSSVSAVLERAIRTATNRSTISFHGSGRTDSGAHARKQVAHLRVCTRFTPSILLLAINSFLPTDIRVTCIEEKKSTFHAQLQAKLKCYRYFILYNPSDKNKTTWPFLYSWTWYIRAPLDCSAMEEALGHLVGEHDFMSFQNTGTAVSTTVRHISEARCIEHKEKLGDFPWMPPQGSNLRLLEICIVGNGFLKQMVRTIVGTVVDIGKGKYDSGRIQYILSQKDRRYSGITAPARALFLDNVKYTANYT